MKVGFALANPTVIELDWSFMPEIFEETAAEGCGRRPKEVRRVR